MMKSIIEILRQLIGMSKDTQETKESVRELQAAERISNDTLKRVIFELERNRENEAHERDKLQLRMENAQLQADRRQLPGEPDPNRFANIESQIAQLKQEIARLDARIDELTEKVDVACIPK